MAELNDLNTLFSGAYSLRYRPSHKSMHLDIPSLTKENFTCIHNTIKLATQESDPVIRISFTSEKWISLSIHFGNENIIVEKIRPMYNLKEKLRKSDPYSVELCLFNYRISGIYLDAKFKISK